MKGRRQFLKTAAALGGAFALGRPLARAEDAQPLPPIPERPPPLALELVKEFVVAGHTDPAKVKAMLDERPQLANATWDWGGGDYETALGGAAHMGRRDIARLLIERGARLDIFAAAMLGELGVIRATLERYPAMIHARGPHGITLEFHAGKGGADAAETLAFLRSLMQ